MGSATGKGGLTTQYHYDEASRLLKTTRRDGTVVSRSYDNAGRLVRIDGPDAWVRYEYDPLGRVALVENAEVTITTTYDVAGRPTSITSDPIVPGLYPQIVTTYAYTPDGQLSTVDSQHSAVTYTYEDQGLLLTQDDELTGRTDYTWLPSRVMEGYVRSTGVQTMYEYSPAGRLTRIHTTDGMNTVEDRTIVRNNIGMIDSITDWAGQHQYGYDADGRLESAAHPAPYGISDEAYVYDSMGNRLEWVGNPAAEVLYDGADRLVQDGDWLYEYDAVGRMVAKERRTSGEVTTFTWNSLDQLVRIGHPDGQETSYKYDGAGQRLEVRHRGEVTRFGWERGELRMVFDGNNALATWISTGPRGFPLAEYDVGSGMVQDILVDHVGSKTGSFSSVSGVTWNPRDTFGNPPAPSSEYTWHAVTHHTQDPTGLVYARARTLDRRLGRFLSEDPLQTDDLYGYAMGNPLSFTDPTGEANAGVNYGRISLISVGLIAGARTTGWWTACHIWREASLLSAVGAAYVCSAAASASAEDAFADDDVEPYPIDIVEENDWDDPDDDLKYVTYLKQNAALSLVYVGRSHGRGSCDDIAATRNMRHHKEAEGFFGYTLDACTVATKSHSNRGSDPSYWAIRGREQQVIDFYGGAWSQFTTWPNRACCSAHILDCSRQATSGNVIRGVGKYNRQRYVYHAAANAKWGEKAGLTDYLWHGQCIP